MADDNDRDGLDDEEISLEHSESGAIGELPEGWEILTSVVFAGDEEPIVESFTNLGTVLAYAMTALMAGSVVTMGIAPAGSQMRTQVIQGDLGDSGSPNDDDPLGAL